MKAYQNLRLKTKLTISFAIMSVLAILIGLTGIVGLEMIRNDSHEMYAENTKPMGDLAAMYDTLASQRICAANMVLFFEADPAFSKEETEALAEKEQLFEEAFADYRETITTSEEQALYDAMEALYFNEFAAIKNDVRTALAGSDVGAMTTAMGEVDNLGAEISGYMDEAFALNVSWAAEKIETVTSLAAVLQIVVTAVMVLGVVCAVLFAWFLARIISVPLSRIMLVAKQMGETGDMEFDGEMVAAVLEDAAHKDELGQTAKAFGGMMEVLVRRSKELEQVAGGDLTLDIQTLGDRDTLGNAVDLMITNLGSMFAEINTATQQVSTGSAQIATGSQSLAQATTEQSATVEELLASVNQVAEKTAENSKRAETAAELAREIRQNAEKGSEEMGRMTQAVHEINDASQAISAVIKVIDDIAFQTNILALNAAVEAARAGEHGKGFAVVADEVRNLAGKSAEAAKNTGSLIANTVEKAELGARIAGETSESLHTIVAGVEQSTKLVGEIALSSEEQSASISEINKGIDQVSQVVQQNSATAEESAASAEEMSSQAAMLKGMVGRFRLKTQQALGSVPAHASEEVRALPMGEAPIF